MFQIFLAVEGVHVKAFGRFPYEFLVEIGSFEVLDNHIHPFLGRNGREFGKKSFLILFHDACFCKVRKQLASASLKTGKITIFSANEKKESDIRARIRAPDAGCK